MGCYYSCITNLDISSRELIELPDYINKYTNLKKLYCGDNKITSLDNLPPTLEQLYCRNNKIISLDNLPSKMDILSCNGNPLKYDIEPTLENIRNYNASRILSI